jgi:hypothetical protein
MQAWKSAWLCKLSCMHASDGCLCCNLQNCTNFFASCALHSDRRTASASAI